jgi:hypothetical protein
VVEPIEAFPIFVSGAGTFVVTIGSVNGFDAVVHLGVKAPAGFTAVLTPSDIAVPAGGSASATLQILPGLSITPGSFSLSLEAASGSVSSSTPVRADVSASTAGVSKVIGALQRAGCIDSPDVANALNGKLESAQTSLDRGDTRTAAEIYKSLLSDLDTQAGKHTSATCTVNGVTFSPRQTLVSDVTALSASLMIK